MDSIRSIASLRVGFNRVTVRVHVLRKWGLSHVPTLHLLLRDSKGSTVEASCCRDVIGLLGGVFTEFSCYDIYDFEVVKRYDRVLVGWWSLSDSPFRLLLTDKTVVTRVLSVPKYSLPLLNSFYGLMTRGLPRNPMIVHLLGNIVGVGDSSTGLMTFTLEDLGGRRIMGSTGGRISEAIQEKWNETGGQSLVCEFRFWSLLKIGDFIFFTTMGEKSDIVFNPGKFSDWSRVLARSD